MRRLLLLLLGFFLISLLAYFCFINREDILQNNIKDEPTVQSQETAMHNMVLPEDKKEERVNNLTTSEVEMRDTLTLNETLSNSTVTENRVPSSLSNPSSTLSEDSSSLESKAIIVNVVQSVIKEEKSLEKEHRASKISIEALRCQKHFKKILSHHKIHFSYNKSHIKQSSYGLLNQLVEAVKECPQSYIFIKGYTDSLGKRDYNRKLSRKRAKSVMRYLVKKGVSKGRLKAIGYGEANPIATNRTKKGRRLNRRIEFQVKGATK